MKLAVSLIALFIGAPIWYYLLYKILVSVQATELMWFLYWIYAPVGILLGTVNKLIESMRH
ncbi:MAG TPA: hypothetical protein VJS69_14205 [Candidatus Krumholzibacteria bacterium]|nr:hypothetical protein [Candidatus Krumholzibacteria bacterium]